MIDPALALGGEVHLYPLRPDLSPDIAAIEAMLGQVSPRVTAVLAAHFFGFAKDFETLRLWCDGRGIALIEDASHTLFTEQFRAFGVGRFGDFVVASPYKFFPCMDGGLLYSSRASDLMQVHTRAPGFIQEIRGLKRLLERSHPPELERLNTASLDDQLQSVAAAPSALGEDLIIEESQPSSSYRRSEEGIAPLNSLSDNPR